ncbi:MAG: lipoprotein [Porticoccus sp.]|nr:lipoprotein [Porticoccus sp.]
MQCFGALRLYAWILLLAVSTVGLTGCGNKGPLYLPPEPVQEITSESGETVESTEAKESEATESE